MVGYITPPTYLGYLGCTLRCWAFTVLAVTFLEQPWASVKNDGWFRAKPKEHVPTEPWLVLSSNGLWVCVCVCETLVVWSHVSSLWTPQGRNLFSGKWRLEVEGKWSLWSPKTNLGPRVAISDSTWFVNPVILCLTTLLSMARCSGSQLLQLTEPALNFLDLHLWWHRISS